MDLSKLSKALSPVNLGDTCNLKVSENFTLKVCLLSRSNQVYNAKLAEFAKAFQNHMVVKDPQGFLNMLYTSEHNTHTVSFTAHVLLCGWELKDDNGEAVEFSKENAVQLLHTPVGRNIFTKLINACTNESKFTVEWSEDAIKNL